MRGKFYCHRVRSEDDGRITVYFCYKENGDGKVLPVTLTAPFEYFEPGEVPRTWHSYKIILELVKE